MTEQTPKYSKEVLETESKTLSACPFCGDVAHFDTNKLDQIILQHFPEAGIICPARITAVADSFDHVRQWWNTRKHETFWQSGGKEI